MIKFGRILNDAINEVFSELPFSRAEEELKNKVTQEAILKYEKETLYHL